MKITKIKLLVLGGLIVIGLNLSGCELGDPYIPDRFEIMSELDYNIYEVRDKETGVHYFYNAYRNEGGISPVYLFNGQVKTTTDVEANKYRGEK